MIRIAIIGAGLIGPRHAQSVLTNTSTELVALVDPSSSGLQVAQALKTAYYASIPSMLEAIHPDAAIVCTPNHTHVAVARELLAADIHVLVEKPISDTLDTGRDLLNFASQPERAHLKLLVGHHRRFNPYVVKTKEIVSSGSLGRIVAVNGLWMLFKPEAYFAPPGDWRQRKASGGVIPINWVHDIDLLQYLFGPVARVHAEKTLPQRDAAAGHDAEEGAALTIRFVSGVVGTFLVCDATPSPHSFEAGTGENPMIPRADGAVGGGGGGCDFYRIFGSRASLSVPDMTRCSYDGRPEKSWSQPLAVERFSVEPATPFDLQLQHFVDVIHGADPVCPGEEGLRALIVCQAVREALDTGKTVEIHN